MKNNSKEKQPTYIYNFDLVWGFNSVLESTDIKPGTIVRNVRKDPRYPDKFYFNIGRKKELFTCNYSWAFILNTPQNIKKYKKYLKIRKKMSCLETQAEKLFDRIITAGVL